ncbi:RNA polymerase sigma factor, sigma-70 family [Longilinea arvoryzae]|uniref:RNA polymerase sigma factor, sigma-70 family n=1 Tax=Longilinea arvoryzae TaxID=360412 RepID=A0A0S7BIC3_9CHLR|nr:sigma-70 family RNA polymerase sigma factor [Longilinea arvoryzae]GAP15501.1 RNA polymerase sigma factor, sigma-70 family [Longilinea arvoryzae]
MDEVALIRDAQHGDLNSFNRLVLAYQELAYNLALRMLNDEASAEDATQLAFISAYRHMNTFRGGSFKAWVMRMVTNTCYDEMRRLKRRPTTPLEPVNDEDDEEIESPYWMADDHNLTPEQALDQRELEGAIQHCLSGLPVDFRAVVIMVDVEGLDYQEVSDATGKPLGTVKSRLARARVKMRDCLQGFWELLPVSFRLKLEERA